MIISIFKYNFFKNSLNFDWYDYGARFYDPVVARFHTVDPLAEIAKNITPYHYCLNNPILNLDPTGMLSVTYTEPDEIAAACKAFGIGQGGTEDSSGSSDSDQDPQDPEKNKKKHTVASAYQEVMSHAPKTEYKSMFDKMYDGDNTSVLQLFEGIYPSADMSGIILSGDGFFAGGMGVDFAVVSVAGDGVYILFNVRGGIGGDISVSLGYILGNSHRSNPTGESLKGMSLSESFGTLGLTVTHWSDYDPDIQQVGINWSGVANQFTLGSKTIVGGNVSFGNTWVSKKLIDYSNE